MPATTDPDFTGTLLRNAFALRRAENALAGEIDALLTDLFLSIDDEVIRRDLAGLGREAVRRRALDGLIRETERLSGKTFGEVLKTARNGLVDVGTMQNRVAVDVLGRVAGAAGVDIGANVVPKELLRAIVDTDPIQGFNIRDWFKGMEASVPARVKRQIQLGMALSENTDQMVRRIRGRRLPGGRFDGGVYLTTRREAASVVRTGVNQIANEAHIQTYSGNEDITQEYEIVATLDSRTTPICAALDGKRFRYDDPAGRRPPFHIGCRTTIVPVVDWEGLGIEAPPVGERASAEGPVPASVNFDGWLRSQSEAVQNDVLGVGRAALWRDGKVGLGGLVQSDLTVIPLKDLQPGAIGMAPAHWLDDLLARGETKFKNVTEAAAFHADFMDKFGDLPEVAVLDNALRDEWLVFSFRLRAEAEKYVATGVTEHGGAKALVDSLGAVRPTERTLYRGLSKSRAESKSALKELAGLSKVEIGQTIEMGPSSFSGKRSVANAFAGRGTGSVVFETVGPVRGIPVQAFGAVDTTDADFLFKQDEWVTAGRWEVVGIRHDGPRRVLQIKQLDVPRPQAPVAVPATTETLPAGPAWLDEIVTKGEEFNRFDARTGQAIGTAFREQSVATYRSEEQYSSLRSAIEEWVATIPAARVLRENAEAYVRTGSTTDPAARALVDSMAQARPVDATLYRGLRLGRGNRFRRQLEEHGIGDEVEFSLSSFSADDAIARDFAGLGDDFAVILRTVGPVRGLPVRALSRFFWREAEWVTAGLWEIVDRRGLPGGGLEVTIRQIDVPRPGAGFSP